jgi:Glycosyl hydrolases family 18
VNRPERQRRATSSARPRPLRLMAFAALLVAREAPAAAPRPEPAPASGRPIVCYVETVFGGARAEQLDLSVCTHVVDAFAVPDAKGALTATNGIPRRALARAARAGGAQVLLAVGGATVTGRIFSQLASDAAARGRFFEALRKLVLLGGYDGVDLDWEFPRPAEAGLFTGFVRALRSSLDAGFREARPGTHPLLFVGVSPADAIESYDFPALAAEVDLFIEYGYDFKNPALGPWASDVKLWPDGSPEKIEGSVRGAASECVRRGLPRQKLVIALPLYASDGRPWEEVRVKALANPLPLHPLYLESPLDGAWVTGPAAIEAKARKILFGDEIAGGAAAGVALWQLGHQGTHSELTEGLRRALVPRPAR